MLLTSDVPLSVSDIGNDDGELDRRRRRQETHEEAGMLAGGDGKVRGRETKQRKDRSYLFKENMYRKSSCSLNKNTRGLHPHFHFSPWVLYSLHYSTDYAELCNQHILTACSTLASTYCKNSSYSINDMSALFHNNLEDKRVLFVKPFAFGITLLQQCIISCFCAAVSHFSFQCQ